MKTKNSGFSLIELIIAISILLILSGMLFLGINTAKRKSTEKSAKELRNQIQLLRTVSMAEAGEWRLCLYEENGEYYCVQERLTGENSELAWNAASERTKLGHKGTVLYELKNSVESPAGGGTPVHIWKFNRDTGACTKGAGTLEVSGSGRTMELTVYQENGRCEVTVKGQ